MTETVETVAPEPTPQPPTETAPVVEETPVSEPEPVTSPGIYQIIQDESEARFILGEVLRGEPTTVIGVTDQVAGEIALSLEDLSTTQIGVIRINARTLATDQDRRNRAIREFILQTDTYEFITFTPTDVIGLPGNAGIGEMITFQIEGDLTIRDITNPVVFDVTATTVSEGRLEGSAATMLRRSDYGLVIPNVPFVAEVDDEVLVELDFVATAAG